MVLNVKFVSFKIFSDTYAEARENIPRAEVTSDLNTEVEDDIRQKRHARHINNIDSDIADDKPIKKKKATRAIDQLYQQPIPPTFPDCINMHQNITASPYVSSIENPLQGESGNIVSQKQSQLSSDVTEGLLASSQCSPTPSKNDDLCKNVKQPEKSGLGTGSVLKEHGNFSDVDCSLSKANNSSQKS